MVLIEVTIAVIPATFDVDATILLLIVEEFTEVAETNEADDVTRGTVDVGTTLPV